MKLEIQAIFSIFRPLADPLIVYATDKLCCVNLLDSKLWNGIEKN